METPFLDTAPKANGNRAAAATMTGDEEDDALVAGAVAAMEAGGGGHLHNHKMASSKIEDEPAVKTVGDAWGIFMMESKKLWTIAVPIGFNVLCLYGLNSSTQIFVGHIGNLQLSAAAIGLSVISNFSFGFLVCPISLFLFLFLLFWIHQSNTYCIACPCIICRHIDLSMRFGIVF